MLRIATLMSAINKSRSDITRLFPLIIYAASAHKTAIAVYKITARINLFSLWVQLAHGKVNP